jgi:hypothetical protein
MVVAFSPDAREIPPKNKTLDSIVRASRYWTV